MNVALLSLRFHLDGCGSLKEKRGRLRGLKDRFGKSVGMAVCEARFADSLTQSEWWFVATAADRVVVERMLTEVERDVESRIDAQVVNIEREWLV